jgi:hypothetical protein
MMPEIKAILNSASHWAAAYQYSLISELSSQPWAKVWACRHQDGHLAVLKVRLPPLNGDMCWLRAFSAISPAECPEVLAIDDKRGFQIFEFIQQPTGLVPRPSHAEILTAYGNIQAKVAQDGALLASLPKISAVQILDRMRAMAETDAAHGPGNAFALFGAETRSRFETFLTRNTDFLVDAARQVDAASLTINHTDLRHANMLRRPNGKLCLFDWDDAATSAPGWSMHTLFSGTSRVYGAVHSLELGIGKTTADADKAAFEQYFDTLTGTGIYDRQTLKEIVPLAAIFGIFKYITDMEPYDVSDRDTADAVRTMVASRFTDLSRLFVLKDKSMPKPVTQQSQSAEPSSIGFPFVSYKTGTNDGQAKLGAQMFQRSGALHLAQCWETSTVTQALEEFSAADAVHQIQMVSGNALKVGDRRYMISLDTSGIFGTPDILAQPRLLNVLDRILGPDYILGSATAVLSLPGSGAQRWHRDNDPLFTDFPNLKLPPFCVAVLVPLVQLNAEVGSTQVVLGSHLDQNLDDETGQVVYAAAAQGDCYLMDSRVLHRGMANLSEAARPVLSLVYQRPWYRDYQNFTKQPALTMSKSKIDLFDAQHRRLVDWAAPT